MEEVEGEDKSRSISSGAGGVILRLFTVFAVAAVSVWANHEASKGFDIYVSNEIANDDAAAARRFHLLFMADDRINRMVLSSSRAAESLLYGENAQNRKKVVKRVSIIVRLSASSHHPGRSLVAGDAGDCAEQCYCYRIYVGSEILGEKADVGMARRVVGAAVQKIMAYVWLSDGDGRAPAALLDGIAEYVTRASVGGFSVAGAPAGEGNIGSPGETTVSGIGGSSSRSGRSRENCWLAEDPGEAAAFIGYCECMSSGFVARLNGKMAEGWRPEMVDEALGTSSKSFCSSFSSAIALESQSTAENCPSWRTWTQ